MKLHHTPIILSDTPEKRADLISKLLAQPEVCFDSETTSLDELMAEVVGLSFTYIPGEAYYVPFPENQDEAKAMMNEFRPFFEK